MSAFDTYLQSVLVRAADEARDDGSASIEAGHVLLAMAVQDGTEAQRALDRAGLGHRALKDALHREFEHSLSAAGVTLGAFDLRSTPDPGRRPQLGASFKLTMERIASVYRKKDLRSVHLLLGVLQAETGTVPRALALAGVDRAGLVERVRAEL